MSIRRRIVEPLLFLAAMCFIALTWISASALSTHRGVSENNAVALQALERAHEAEAAYLELRRLVERVTDMVVMLDPDETIAVFDARTTRLRDALAELNAMTLGAQMGDALSRLEGETGRWIEAAAIIVGAKSSPRLPARHVNERSAERVADGFVKLIAAVRGNSNALARSARAEFLEQITLALAALAAMLGVVTMLALRSSIRLAGALRALHRSMTLIEHGELSKPVPGLERQDEIGAMARSVGSFAAGLRQLTAAKSRIEHLAMHDPLTGLPNRRFLHEQLGVKLAAGAGRSVAVLHVDLDRFKTVNDTRGHAAGDAVLRQAAAVMRSGLREGDFAARAGGDEFVIVLDEVDDEARLTRLAERVIEAMGRPIVHDGQACQVGASIGVAVGRAGEIDAERLLMNADIALYAAKNAGRGACRFFSESLRETLERKDLLARQLKEALERGEIEPFFQPQIASATGRLCGFEALVRWRQPEGGVMAPSQFLSVAEEMGLIEAIGEAVLAKSLEALLAWRAAGYDAPRVAINFSERELRTPGFADTLLDRVRDAGLAPTDIAVEVLESALIDDDADADEAVRNFALLERFGFPIELDDFGTEHASISNLKKFKVSRIKIDRSFVTGIDHDAEQETIVKTLIDLSDRLSIEALAEGVETEAERSKLIALGCGYLQGYAIGMPMPFEECCAWIDGHQRGARLGIFAS